MGRWKEIPVTADIAIEVEGETILDLFRTCAEAMFSLMFERREGKIERTIEFSVEGEDEESLLVNFLSECLFYINVERIVPLNLDAHLRGKWRMDVKLSGRSFYPQQPSFIQEIKAVTYHNLKIIKEDNIFKTTIVFDV